MATKYARLRIGLEVSTASDYSRAVEHGITVTATPDEYRIKDVIDVATSAQTYTLSYLVSLTDLLIKNNDTTNYVTVTWRSAGNSSVDNIVRLAAGKSMLLNDVTVASNLTLTADTAVVEVEISYLGT